MTLDQLLEITKKDYDKFTLIIQKYESINGGYPNEIYECSPIFDYSEKDKWDFDNYIVLIPFHKSIDIGRNWKNWNILTCVVTTRKQLLKHYSESQLNHWLEWLDKEVKKEVLKK